MWVKTNHPGYFVGQSPIALHCDVLEPHSVPCQLASWQGTEPLQNEVLLSWCFAHCIPCTSEKCSCVIRLCESVESEIANMIVGELFDEVCSVCLIRQLDQEFDVMSPQFLALHQRFDGPQHSTNAYSRFIGHENFGPKNRPKVYGDAGVQ